MSRIVLDAGPLIGLSHASDYDHNICVRGFAQLTNDTTALLVPLPIGYEVYK